MASVTTATSPEIAALLAATRKAAYSIQKLGQGKYVGADINAQLATEIDAQLAALKVALDAVVV